MDLRSVTGSLGKDSTVFYKRQLPIPSKENREVKHHVYVKRQTRICTMWPSFLLTCRLLFIISTPKLIVSRNFLSIRIVLSCVYLLFFYFEKFSTWIWRLPFAVYVRLKLSNRNTCYHAIFFDPRLNEVLKQVTRAGPVLLCDYLTGGPQVPLFLYSFSSLSSSLSTSQLQKTAVILFSVQPLFKRHATLTFREKRCVTNK